MMNDIQVPPTVKPYADGQDASGTALEEAFPVVDPQFRPFGAKILVQVRRVMRVSKGGIILGTESKETEAWNMQVGKIIDVGPLAFKNRATSQPWPEGMWANIGDFVRFPRHVGDRLTVAVDDGRGDPVVILILDDHSLLGAYTGDPMKVRAFIQ
jgi:co-chaperonin GroES (HSP10)